MRVEAKKVTMHFNDAGRVIEVFRDLTLGVPSGSTLAIVGESGVGKTTLLHILGGLEQPVSGDVILGGTSLAAVREQNGGIAKFRGANIGFIFQFHHLLPEFDAVENAAMPLIIQRRSRTEARESASALLARVGLSHRLSHRPSALSGGEQQRVAIARALATGPGLVLADEPTGNLDLKTSREVADLLLEIHREQKITLIVVTHSLELARRLDTVVELTATGLKRIHGGT